ncbi:hypothetical protein B0H13DRAFT_1648208 [Mycena leptocephala]|nr:hypothetical protein B0H13DRAFT_1648208 [Mycena leptocephala]
MQISRYPKGRHWRADSEIFAFGREGTNSPTHVATLELPELDPSGHIESMQILAGLSCARPLSGTPFSKSNDNHIFGVGMVLQCPNDTHWCNLFVHHRSLYKYVLEHITAATIVSWDHWGPQNSRTMVGEHTWNRHVHGERVALRSPGPNRNSVEILNFNIIPARDGAAADTPSSTEVTNELHLGPSTLRLDSIFKDTVVTSLPYNSTLRSLDEEYDGFLIDQDRILGINDSVGAFHIQCSVALMPM